MAFGLTGPGVAPRLIDTVNICFFYNFGLSLLDGVKGWICKALQGSICAASHKTFSNRARTYNVRTCYRIDTRQAF